jgi:hypothetical protein
MVEELKRNKVPKLTSEVWEAFAGLEETLYRLQRLNGTIVCCNINPMYDKVNKEPDWSLEEIIEIFYEDMFFFYEALQNIDYGLLNF